MKKAFLFLAIAFGISAYGQTTFKKGNFVNKQGNTVECLIKNHDWVGMPKEIEYKLTEDGEAQQLPAENLTSFYIYGTSHYYKTFDVPIVGIQKGDVFVKSGWQLLKVLLEGKASLYKSADGIYMLQVDNQPVKPLIYKRYIENDIVRENTAFRLELFNSLKCDGITQNDFKKLSYSEKKFIKLISSYNTCKNSDFKLFTDKKAKSEFNITLMGGMSFSSIRTDVKKDGFVIVHPVESNSTNFSAGFEAEYRFPFNNKKWSLFVNPVYNSHKGTKEHINNFLGGYNGDVIIGDYSYIELPIGVKYRKQFNSNSWLSLGIAAGPVFELNSDDLIRFVSDNPNINPGKLSDDQLSKTLLRLGASYTIKSKYSFGVNYYISKELSKSTTNGSISVLLGYKLF